VISVFSPRYKHRNISSDEKSGLSVEDVMFPEGPLPQKCGDCCAASSIRNPLLMKPYFTFSNGMPKGTLYQARCALCQEARVRRRTA